LIYRSQQRHPVLDEYVTGGRWRQAACVAFKQRRTDRAFEFANATAGSSQRQSAFTSRGTQASGVSTRDH
jgi:hypothetical protein